MIGNINGFAHEGKPAAYLGIVPRVSKSNNTVHYGHGRITKAGSELGRTTLVQCTLVAIRYSPYLRSCYKRRARRRAAGRESSIATARKLLGIIYETLKNGWVFEDFPTFVYTTT